MISCARAIPLEKSIRKKVSAILFVMDFICIVFKSIFWSFILLSKVSWFSVIQF